MCSTSPERSSSASTRFFGFQAIDRLQLVQKPVSAGKPPRRRGRTLSKAEEARLEEMASGIEDEELRASLLRLGRSIKKESE